MTEAPPAKKPRSTFARFLIGTAIGCGTVMVLMVAGCVGCYVWLNTPGDVLAPDSLLARDTVGYVEWTVDLEDPGTRELLDAMFARLEAMQRRNAPEGGIGRFLAQMQQWNQRRNERELRKLFPVVLAATLRRADDGSHGVLFAGSARGMDHQLVLADWIGTAVLKRSLDAEVLTHADETILVLPGSVPGDSAPRAAAFLRGGDLFVATTVAEAVRTVDLLTGRTPEAIGVTGLSRWYAEMPDTAVRGALANGDGELARVWSALAATFVGNEPIPADAVPEELWREVEGAVVSGGLDGAGAFALEVTLDLTSASAAESAAPVLATASTRLLADSIFRLEGTVTDGGRVRLDIVTEPLVDALDRLPAEGG